MSTLEAKVWTKPEGKVKIKLIVKSVNPLITDPEHEAYNLFGRSNRAYTLPVDRAGNLINPFTCEEEQRWLEKELGLDLNYHRKDDNYWHKAEVVLDKSDKIIDLSNPKQYMDYVLARANKQFIAPSINDQNKKATYKYVIVEENEEVKVVASKAKLRTAAYKFLGKIEDDKEEMINFLKVYGKKVSPASKIEFLSGELEKIITEDLDGFLAVSKDKDNYELKLLISDAVDAGAIIKDKRKYFLPGGDPLCGEGDSPTIENAIIYLKNKANQDILSTLKARIKNAKD
jgi:ribosomal protein S20